jgi:hypothetical protein
MLEKLFKAKYNKNEEDGFEELMTMTKEELEERVEPLNEAYPINEVGSVVSDGTLMALCDPAFYEKIKSFKEVSVDEMPDYIYKDLCHEIGKRILAGCRIEYKIDMMQDKVKFIAVRKDK